jgi:hypothetical protein
MTAQVTVTLSTRLSKQVRELAKLRQQNLKNIVEAELDKAIETVQEKENVDWAEPDEAVDREMQAFIALHPVLKKKYFGQYVAFHDGKLIDHDINCSALRRRIIAQYPDMFVWISEVEEEPIRTYTLRAPRIERVL